ncbi:hypothetical protein HYH03_017995 [Edaphochlamys debaryana]|uniref:DNA topoisomerase (ATP-hydrolyzing) n=1 Tax=Edaphochlamys debaryana TaxID=47281 RepID=A0A836BNC2_9CHLO|nr:hypothetical protein HYH03_017995 [Edaphochlamys debaryana]|eukprot:KAG2483101.1 hypothetical protein HYH03_017995 [Edaphochlamys debaryana]
MSASGAGLTSALSSRAVRPAGPCPSPAPVPSAAAQPHLLLWRLTPSGSAATPSSSSAASASPLPHLRRGALLAATATARRPAARSKSGGTAVAEGPGGSGAGAADGGSNGSGNGAPPPDGAASSPDGGGGMVEERELVEETKEAMARYGISVMTSRAIPDVRDGLKPVHRRILFAMHELGLSPNKPYRKCARVVGEVLGKLHPHGDSAVYEALVRMAQPFAMREPLIDGQGNFGSVDDDPAAAMRYTEARLRPLAAEVLLGDLGAKDTVTWRKTFDQEQEEPEVLPASVPNLLVNGTQGIAVAVASTIPPHNLGEVVAGLRALIAQPGAGVGELMAHVRGPDFPTGGQLLAGPGLEAAYTSGKGTVVLRGTATIEHAGEGGGKKGSRKRGGRAAAGAAAAAAGDEEEAGSGGGGYGRDRDRIVITELPYQVCKSDLVRTIAELAEEPREKKKGEGGGGSSSGGGGGGGSSSKSAMRLEGVAEVRDESDREGLRVVVDVKRGASPEAVLDQLYRLSKLQVSIHINSVALVGGRPRLLGLRDILQHFLDFRCEVISRRSNAALKAKQARLHIVEGLLGLLKGGPARLDAVVAAIRAAADAAAARAALVAQHGLSEAQATAVLDLTLRRLTGLEAARLEREGDELRVEINRLLHILSDRAVLLSEVDREAAAVAAAYGNPRRTKLLDAQAVAAAAPPPALLSAPPSPPCLVLGSARGFLRRLPEGAVAAQRRSTRGKALLGLRGGDSLTALSAPGEGDTLLLLGPGGRAYGTAVDAVPQAKEGATTRSDVHSIANVLKLDDAFPIAAMLPIPPDVSAQAAAAAAARRRTAAGAAAASAAAAAAAALDEGEGEEEAEEAAEVEGAEEAEEAVEEAGDDAPSLLLCSRGGYIARRPVPRKNQLTRKGLQVFAPAPGDELRWAALARSPRDLVVLMTARGQGLVFPAGEVRRTGSAGRGVKAVAFGSPRRPGDHVADVSVIDAALAEQLRAAEGAEGEEEAEGGPEAAEEEHEAAAAADGAEDEGGEGGAEASAAPKPASGPCLLIVTSRGHGKRLKLSDIALGRRARAGQKLIKLAAAPKPGSKGAAAAAAGGGGGAGAAAAAAVGPERVVAAALVRDGDEVVLGSKAGVVVRIPAESILMGSRASMAKILMALDAGDELADVAVLPAKKRTADADADLDPETEGSRPKAKAGAAGGGAKAAGAKEGKAEGAGAKAATKAAGVKAVGRATAKR